jgi:hypothetical protein
VKHWVPQCSVFGPLFFLLYVNDLSKIISDKTNPDLSADDTSIIITNSNPSAFRKNTHEDFGGTE